MGVTTMYEPDDEPWPPYYGEPEPVDEENARFLIWWDAMGYWFPRGCLFLVVVLSGVLVLKNGCHWEI